MHLNVVEPDGAGEYLPMAGRAGLSDDFQRQFFYVKTLVKNLQMILRHIESDVQPLLAILRHHSD